MNETQTVRKNHGDGHKCSERKFLVTNQFQVVGPAGPLVAVAGEDLVLPCSLKPNISAVDMTVEWSRLHGSDTLVHLYTDHEDRNEKQIQSYRERTALFKEELQKGNTSLKLFKVRVSDEGEYKCLIDNKNWQDDVTVEVRVEAVGTHPAISMEGYDHSGRLSLLCETKGWNPEPEILWLNSEGDSLPAENTETDRDTEGFNVKQRVIVQDSNTNRLFCRVLMRDHMRETEIYIPSKVFHTWKTAVTWISLLSIFFVIILGTMTIYIYKFKEEGSAVLVSGLNSNTSSLKKLDLSSKNLYDSGVKLLSAELKKSDCEVEILG
ncbi:butyrophilin subfamily 1 member A1 [Chanos chanos]|uniref:Butyrophilin subfamily 1 member A1 n=1 Tax=Chanos chanos TaxID=29144 RepID=A0A6J2VL71_CHACN|nr:butyrophilin subfamily 1 member A1-like [Chanos chanos]